MIVELGHYALVLALALSLVLTVIPAWGAHTRDAALMGVARPAAFAMLFFTAASFVALAAAYVGSDFSVLNVFQNSHSAKPLAYKISGVWSNHEGSMLLWVLILAIFAGLVAWRGAAMPRRLLSYVLSVQGAIAAAFFLFILLTSNPFARVMPAPFEGEGLNPLLQDPGLAIHPPLLYLGYVGFSVAFSFAVGALLEGRIDAVWARFVRPWTLLAWAFLTLGIAMGSYWAYYELGWGGWWFWDPVENASLMPWLAGTALVHSIVVMEKRDALKVWTILLSILAFSLSLIGTFLVRSGVLTSVHSFASDPARGVFILCILVFFIGGGLTLFAWRAPVLRQGGLFAPVSREGALVLNNLFLAAACAAVFIGTLYPLALEAVTGAKISVGPPFFEATFLPLIVPLLLLVPVGQTLAWKRGDLLGVLQRLSAAFGLAFVGTIIVFATTRGGPVAAPLGVGLGFWLILGSLSEITSRSHRRGASVLTVLRRAAGLPRAAWGSAIAHAGVGVTVIGIAATAWGVERIATLKPGEQIALGPYQVTLEGVVPRNGPDYREVAALMVVRDGDRVIGRVEPGKRTFIARTTATSEAGLLTVGLGQIYASVAEVGAADGSAGVRLYWKPWVLLIWLGSVAMAAGGVLSLSDRRARVAAPARRAVPAAVPAE
ncbi:cytochrome c-type biogenesis protein CycK [Alsobacter metallidurans]|uniref:Cytochrome c-type biogenesis protein CycK n=1 Tax=Alsobacter metallidurans TaxID=340221 RepID=A0A917I5C2_9HYPH|nr:heme lyase CcmF/NrfE family subunit [Alsobacter metallidurans]GGH14000.1 cytochrome c-type biogenesis protein CycK [Alsobacter metallidurans]